MKGKILYCVGFGNYDYTIKELGGAGAIGILEGPTDTAYTTLIPGTSISPKDGSLINNYVNSNKY